MDDKRYLWKYQLLGIIAGVALGFAAELPLSLFTTKISGEMAIHSNPPRVVEFTEERYITGLPNVPAIGAVVGWLAGGMIWAVMGYKLTE